MANAVRLADSVLSYDGFMMGAEVGVNGIDFEHSIAEKMKKFGWDTELTPASNDFGADVICKLGEDKLAIQCKYYSDESSIGVSAIQEIFGAKAHYGANHAIVIYRGRITSSAQSLAESTGVLCFHIRDLVPGWKYDRSAEGKLERQKRVDAQKAKLQEIEAIINAKRVEMINKFEEEYNSKINIWNGCVSEYEKWKKYSAFFVIITFVIIVAADDSPKDKSWISLAWVPFLLAVYGLFFKRPGDRPEKMDKHKRNMKLMELDKIYKKDEVVRDLRRMEDGLIL